MRTGQRILQLGGQRGVLGAQQGDRGAGGAGATSAPHSVHVRLHGGRRVHVHHRAHPLEVDAPAPGSGAVGCDGSGVRFTDFTAVTSESSSTPLGLLLEFPFSSRSGGIQAGWSNDQDTARQLHLDLVQNKAPRGWQPRSWDTETDLRSTLSTESFSRQLRVPGNAELLVLPASGHRRLAFLAALAGGARRRRHGRPGCCRRLITSFGSRSAALRSGRRDVVGGDEVVEDAPVELLGACSRGRHYNQWNSSSAAVQGGGSRPCIAAWSWQRFCCSLLFF